MVCLGNIALEFIDDFWFDLVLEAKSKILYA